MSTGLPSPPQTPPGSPRSASDGDRADTAASGPSRGAQAPGAQRWAPSPRLPARELALVLAAGVLLALLTTWPLVAHMSSRIAPDLGDPVRTAWEVAWVGHAMLSQPLHLFDANTFYPHPLSLAFSDSLLGYGPAAFFGSGTIAALVRYNLLFLFAWSLCFVGAYLLARELGLGRLGGAAAGIAFAYAPYRVTEAGHLHVISSGGLPLALFLLLRGYRRSSRSLVLAGWLVSAWQVSLGFTLGLQYCYLLAVLALLVLVQWWRGRLRPGPGWRAEPAAPAAAAGAARAQARILAAVRSRGALLPARLLIVTVIGVAALGAVAIYQARPYLQVSNEYPTAKRTIKEVENYSSGPAALLSASTENRVWGAATAGVRAKVHSKNEDVFFPGGLILALSLLGLAGVGGALYTRNLRLGLVLGALTCSVLAMGLGLTGAGYPYRLLYDHAPGWNGVRVPGRVFTLGTLFYALLAGAGAQAVVRLLGPLARRHSLPAAPALVGVLALIGLLGEGAGHLGHPVVPQPQKAEVGLPGPLLDLPTDGAADRVWQYFSTNGFYKIPIGNSTFDIPAVDDLRGGMSGFPDRASIEKLRYYGIRTVVLHLTMPALPGIHGYAIAEPPNPAAAAAKPVAGLGVVRRKVGSLVIYEIGPGPSALHGTD
ncbi:MAG TPA: hypothetical protein VG366_04255 [Solirubrobacteraceae bacterium]|jgi:hypothetical protein|nr:hypothetical protein [Solirubrobacteraceae bacterium]